MSIWDILNIVIPIVMVVGIGYLVLALQWFPKSAVPALGMFVSNIAVPLALFTAIAPLDLRSVFDWRLVLVFGSVGLIMVGVSLMFARRILRYDLSASAIVAVGAATCNGVMFGLPIMGQAFGDVGIVALSVMFLSQSVFLVPFILVLADLGRNDRQNAASVVGKAVIDAIRNPLITAILAGVAVAALGIELPVLIAKPASLLGVAGPGLALFFAGAILQSAKMSGQFSVVTGITALKLFLFPAAMYFGLLAAQWLTASLGWPAVSKELLSAIFVLSTMPMIGVFVPLAAKYGVGESAAAAMLPTTILAAFTISAALWMASNLTLFG